MTQVFTRPDPYATEQAQIEALRTETPELRGMALGTGQPETLEEMGHALLDLIVQASVAKGVVLPSRQAVYMAPIPADCEQVAVLFTGWNPTPVPESPTICKLWRWIAPMSAIITRCTPAVPPAASSRAAKLTERTEGPLKTVSTSQLNAASAIASADSEVFLHVMHSLGEVGTDTSITANPPQGGFQTVELNVSLISGSSFL